MAALIAVDCVCVRAGFLFLWKAHLRSNTEYEVRVKEACGKLSELTKAKESSQEGMQRFGFFGSPKVKPTRLSMILGEDLENVLSQVIRRHRKT